MAFIYAVTYQHRIILSVEPDLHHHSPRNGRMFLFLLFCYEPRQALQPVVLSQAELQHLAPWFPPEMREAATSQRPAAALPPWAMYLCRAEKFETPDDNKPAVIY